MTFLLSERLSPLREETVTDWVRRQIYWRHQLYAETTPIVWHQECETFSNKSHIEISALQAHLSLSQEISKRKFYIHWIVS